MLSFASAILQAFTAIAVVSIAAILLGATAKAMGDTVRVIEIVSYALIILIGLRLLWVKGRAFLALLWPHAHEHHGHHHQGHAHAHSHDQHHDHAEEASAWGHAHAPEPQELAGRHWLRRGWQPSFAVGLRPCSAPSSCWYLRWRKVCSGSEWPPPRNGHRHRDHGGGIATLAVGARGTGRAVGEGQARRRHDLHPCIGTAAALVIVAFGALLHTGYMVSERLMGV